MAPGDAIFGIIDRFVKDTSPKKVNLSIGVYRTAEGEPFCYESIRKAEEEMVQNNVGKDYEPYEGNSDYIRQAKALVFGDNPEILDKVPP